MRLTYWWAECIDDANAYSIRTRTKREGVALREKWGADRFRPPIKVSVEYDNAFDLLLQCSGECSMYWEGPNPPARGD